MGLPAFPRGHVRDPSFLQLALALRETILQVTSFSHNNWAVLLAMQCNALQIHSVIHSFIHSDGSSLQECRFYVPWGGEGKAGLITCAMPRLAAVYKYMALHVGTNTVASASLTSARIQPHGLCLPDEKFNSVYSTQYF